MLEPAKSNDAPKPLSSFYKFSPFLSHRAPSPAIHFLSGENVSLRSHFLHQENVFYSIAVVAVEPFLKKIACRIQWCHWFWSQGHLKVTKGHLKVIIVHLF